MNRTTLRRWFRRLELLGIIAAGVAILAMSFVDYRYRVLLLIFVALVIAALEVISMFLPREILIREVQQWNEDHPNSPIHPDPEQSVELLRASVILNVFFCMAFIVWLVSLW